jgi:hypothetical protein
MTMATGMINMSKRSLPSVKSMLSLNMKKLNKANDKSVRTKPATAALL